MSIIRTSLFLKFLVPTIIYTIYMCQIRNSMLFLLLLFFNRPILDHLLNVSLQMANLFFLFIISQKFTLHISKWTALRSGIAFFLKWSQKILLLLCHFRLNQNTLFLQLTSSIEIYIPHLSHILTLKMMLENYGLPHGMLHRTP